MKLLCCAILSTWMVLQIQGKPYSRYRRSDDIKYAPCKNIYPQCPEWKNKYGWCESAQYKDYMAQVCPAICEFCRETSSVGTLEEVRPIKSDALPQANPATDHPYDEQAAQLEYQKQMQKYYESVQKSQQEYEETIKRQDPAYAQSAPVATNENLNTQQYAPQQNVDNSQYQTAGQYQAPAVEAAAQYQTQPSLDYNAQYAAVQAAAVPHVPPNPASVATAEVNNVAPANHVEKENQIKLKPNQNSPKDNDKSKDLFAISDSLYPKPKPKDNSVALNRKEGSLDEDATNEKAETESKHLDDKHIISREKKMSEKKENEIVHKKIEAAKKETKTVPIISSSDNHARSDTENNDDDDSDDEAENSDIISRSHENSIIQKNVMNTKTTTKENKRKEKNINVIHKSKQESLGRYNKENRPNKANFHVEKSDFDTRSNTKYGEYSKKNEHSSSSKRAYTRQPTNENNLNEESESESGDSGSGNAGEMENALTQDLEELSFITGLNFDETDYDIGDDISEDLLSKGQDKGASISNIQHDNEFHVSKKDIVASSTSTKESQTLDKMHDFNRNTIEKISVETIPSNKDELSFIENKPQSRSEINHPEPLQNLIVRDNDDDDDDSDNNDENESGANDDEPEEKPKTLLKSMHEQGQLKAYAVSKPAENKTDSSSNTKSSTKSDIGELPAESGSDSGSGEQNESDQEISGDNLPEEEAEDQEKPESRNTSDLSTSSTEAASDELKQEKASPETSSSSKKPSSKESPSSLKFPSPNSKAKDQNKVAADFLPEELLPATQKERKQNEKEAFGSGKAPPEGKISFVLKQQFNSDYLDKSSTPYQLLSGNIKKDVETALKGSKIKDIAFSEATIEGNPRQTGKTKVSFTLSGTNQKVMKELLKLVDAGDVNGLALIKSSLETEDDE